MTDCIIVELTVVGQTDNQINQNANSYLISMMRNKIDTKEDKNDEKF